MYLGTYKRSPLQNASALETDYKVLLQWYVPNPLIDAKHSPQCFCGCVR